MLVLVSDVDSRNMTSHFIFFLKICSMTNLDRKNCRKAVLLMTAVSGLPVLVEIQLGFQSSIVRFTEKTPVIFVRNRWRIFI